MSKQHIVWVKETGKWEPNGDGSMSQTTAERVANDLRKMGYPARVLPVGQTIPTK